MRQVVLQHATTGTRRHDDVIVAAKRVENPRGKVARRGAVAGIVGGLTAAGLRAWYFDLTSGLFQQPDRREADRRSMQVDQTGDEQRDAGSA